MGVLIVLAMLAMAGCGKASDQAAQTDPAAAPEPDRNYVDLGLYSGAYVSRVKLGDCWYVVAYGGSSSGRAIVHAGDCDNPIHAHASDGSR